MGAMLGILSAYAALIIVLQAVSVRRMRRLKRDRAREDFGTFAAHFKNEAVSEEILFGVYSHFQHWVQDKEFPIRPHDSISGVYGIVNEDFYDLIDSMIGRFGSHSAISEEIKQVQTVGDLVRFLAP